MNIYPVFPSSTPLTGMVSQPYTRHPGHKLKDCECLCKAAFRDYLISNLKQKMSWSEIYDRASPEIKSRYHSRVFFSEFTKFCSRWSTYFPDITKKNFRQWPVQRMKELLDFCQIPPELFDKIIANQKGSNTSLIEYAPHPGHKSEDCDCICKEAFKDYLVSNLTNKTSWREVYKRAPRKVKQRYEISNFYCIFLRFSKRWGSLYPEIQGKNFRRWPDQHMIKVLEFCNIPPELHKNIILNQRKRMERYLGWAGIPSPDISYSSITVIDKTHHDNRQDSQSPPPVYFPKMDRFIFDDRAVLSRSNKRKSEEDSGLHSSTPMRNTRPRLDDWITLPEVILFDRPIPSNRIDEPQVDEVFDNDTPLPNQDISLQHDAAAPIEEDFCFLDSNKTDIYDVNLTSLSEDEASFFDLQHSEDYDA